jgi:hypothetical protein
MTINHTTIYQHDNIPTRQYINAAIHHHDNIPTQQYTLDRSKLGLNVLNQF